MSVSERFPMFLHVYCADLAHLRQGEAEPRRAEVTSFVKHKPGDTWQEFAGHTAEEKRQIQGTQVAREREAERTGNPFARKLPGSKNDTHRRVPADDRSRELWRQEFDEPFADYEPADRLKYELTCKLCPGKRAGTRLTVRVRDENLQPALDRIASTGCRDVPLRVLAYTLKLKHH